IQNITINLTGDRTGSLVTSSTGYYEFCVRSRLNYTVTPESLIWNFTPVNYSYNNIIADQADQDFTGSITSIISPTQLTADPISLTQVNLTWSDNSGNEDGFRIERRDGDAGFWVQIGNVGAGITAYSDTSGLNRAANYYYRVYAWNSLGSSGYSNEVRVRFKALDTEFKVYPNPVKPGDTVRFANLNGPGTIKILDTYGNLIKDIPFTGTETTWDLSGSVDPGSGVYIYHIKDNNGEKTGKIIILR
ncbi:MAG TPA: T9SS type A sorting domain-containing protein, partial [Firmicutes bacterium]|nr:T9SS type A sorting domain-containing protein [Bacillota bacterium]